MEFWIKKYQAEPYPFGLGSQREEDNVSLSLLGSGSALRTKVDGKDGSWGIRHVKLFG
jgi:hypothetical protein